MAKTTDSTKSESWTARVPNSLANAAREHAIALGMKRDDGSANTTEIIHTALKHWLGMGDNSPNIVKQDAIQRLEIQIAELFDILSNTVSKTELEEVRAAVSPHQTEPIVQTLLSTQALCEHLGVNYTNLSTRGRKHNRSPDQQLIAEALEQGQHWQVCDRNGRQRIWEQVGARC